MPRAKKRVAVLAAGGQCPGINQVIQSFVLACLTQGLEVLGILDGFSGLAVDEAQARYRVLTRKDVKGIGGRAGNPIIGMGRYSLAKRKVGKGRARKIAGILQDLGVTELLAIGGDDTRSSLDALIEACEELGIKLRCVHAPKTIDNDFALPSKPKFIHTFGARTAASQTAKVIRGLHQGNVFLIEVMGRYTGFLPYAAAKKAQLRFCFLPEMYEEGSAITDLADHVALAVRDMWIKGMKPEPIVIGEGVFAKFNPACKEAFALLGAIPALFFAHLEEQGIAEFEPGQAVKELSAVLKKAASADNGADLPVDDSGHIHLGNIAWLPVLGMMVEKRLKAMGISWGVRGKPVGYEVRNAAPNDFDRDYCDLLGKGACNYLLARRKTYGATLYVDDGNVCEIASADLPRENGRIKIRQFDPTWHTHAKRLKPTYDLFELDRKLLETAV